MVGVPEGNGVIVAVTIRKGDFSTLYTDETLVAVEVCVTARYVVGILVTEILVLVETTNDVGL
jgi:hypothetical protein